MSSTSKRNGLGLHSASASSPGWQTGQESTLFVRIPIRLSGSTFPDEYQRKVPLSRKGNIIVGPGREQREMSRYLSRLCADNNPHVRVRTLMLRLIAIDHVMPVAQEHDKQDVETLRKDRRIAIRAIAAALYQVWGGPYPRR